MDWRLSSSKCFLPWRPGHNQRHVWAAIRESYNARSSRYMKSRVRQRYELKLLLVGRHNSCITDCSSVRRSGGIIWTWWRQPSNQWQEADGDQKGPEEIEEVPQRQPEHSASEVSSRGWCSDELQCFLPRESVLGCRLSPDMWPDFKLDSLKLHL